MATSIACAATGSKFKRLGQDLTNIGSRSAARSCRHKRHGRTLRNWGPFSHRSFASSYFVCRVSDLAGPILGESCTILCLMISQIQRSLGVLLLERGLPPGIPLPMPLPGSLLNSDTFDFPVIVEVIAGAWVENVVRGDAALEPAYVAAARRLVERGAVAISSDCGFSIRHQATVAASVNVPVAMSSLLILPALLRQLPRPAKIAVLTYDSIQFDEDLLGINDPAERARIVVGGIEGSKYWHDGFKRPLPPPDVAAIETAVTTCVARLHAAHQEIAAILFECTAFPLVAPVIRRITKLPVYDITSLCRMMIPSAA